MADVKCKELKAREESTWKVSEMKAALAEAGVATGDIGEKSELLKATRELIADVEASPEKYKKKSIVGDMKGFSSDEEDDAAEMAKAAEKAKAKGNASFGAGEFQEAVKHFTLAIRCTPTNHVLHSNRSGAYASLGKATEALTDADKCVELAPQWAKGHGRRGAALTLQGKYKEAMRAYKRGLELEPENAGLLKGLADLKKSLQQGEVPRATDAPSSAVAPKAAASKAERPPRPKATGPIGQQWVEAAKRGDREAMEELLEENDKDGLVGYHARGIGHTAMHWAASRGERALMDWLKGLGEELNSRNASEATPLHAAASSGQAMSVEWLLTRGADTSLKNDDGKTAADVARSQQRLDIASTIERYVYEPTAAPPPVAAGTAAMEAPAPWEDHEEEVD